MKKFSIITVCKNAADLLEPTIISVLNQRYRHIEYIIIDGNSTDATKKILQKYQGKLIVHSGPDKGVFDAMNKGLTLAEGDIIYFLNAGDSLADKNILAAVAKQWPKGSGLVFGDIITFGAGLPERRERFSTAALALVRHTICHQAIFADASLFKRFGGFSLRDTIAADYDWLLKLVRKHRIKAQRLPLVVARYRLGGISDRPEQHQKAYREHYRIARRYFPEWLVALGELLDRWLSRAAYAKKVWSR